MTRSEIRTRPSVERVFSLRRDLRSKAEAIKWEESLSDWEWINLWAAIYSIDLMEAFEQTTIKH